MPNENTTIQTLISDQPTHYNFYTWQTKLISGAVIGLANSTAVTPVVNYTNHVMNRHAGAVKFTCARAFDGLAMYNISFVSRVSVALSLDSLFLHHFSTQGEVSHHHTLLSSIVSGGIAGSVATLAEAVAQTQQLSEPKPSARAIVKQAYLYNGFFGLARGMPEMMARSAGLTAGFLAFMPPLCQRIRHELGGHWLADELADVFSALLCGLAVGIITTPPNNLRFDRQKDFSLEGPARTYAQIWQDKCTTKDGAYRFSMGVNRLFVGLKPQTLRCMMSMYIITKGNDMYHLFTEDGLPDLPSFQLK